MPIAQQLAAESGSDTAAQTDVAAYHDIRFTFDPRRAAVWRALCGYIQPWVQADRPLLELGAGYGEFSRFIECESKLALDVNPKLTDYWPPEARAIIQSALDPLPLDEGSLGGVFASNFFEHFTLEEGERILSEVRRTLAVGGRLICVQPNYRLEPRRYFDDYTHKQIYTDASFRDFLEANGYRVIHHEPRFTPFTMKSRLPTAAWLVALYLRLPYRPFAGQFFTVAEKR